MKKLNLAYTNLENLNCFSSYNYNNKLYLTDLNLEGNKIDNIAKLNYLKASTFNLNLKNQHYDMKIIKKEEILKKQDDIGYYICKDCGYLYDVPYCTFPISTAKCINNHIIGIKT